MLSDEISKKQKVRESCLAIKSLDVPAKCYMLCQYMLLNLREARIGKISLVEFKDETIIFLIRTEQISSIRVFFMLLMDQRINSVVYIKVLNEPMKILLSVSPRKDMIFFYGSLWSYK